MTLAATAIPARFERPFAFVAVVVMLVLIASACLFPGEATGAVRVWIHSRTYNHCFLVLPLALFLIWERQSELRSIPIAPDLKATVAVFLLGLVWLGVGVLGILEAQQLIVLTMIEVTLFAVLGARMFGAIVGPLLYLYFLVPSGAFLVPALQTFTAHFAVAGLHVLGIPVYSTGALIEIPAGTFAVAEACAGLRFLIAAVAFGVFFAILTYRSPWRRAFFIALCVGVPVIANGFRALGLIAAAEWIGSASAALADHVLYGWIFFSLVLLALIAIGRKFSDGGRQDCGTVTSTSASHLPTRKMLTVGLACAVAALVGPVIGLAANGTEVRAAPAAPPRVYAPWREISGQSGWRPVVVLPAHAFQHLYSDGRHRVERYVAVYDWPDHGKRFIRSDNRDADEETWRFNSARFTSLPVHRQRLPVRLSVWVRGSKTRLVWSFYVVGGRVAATQLDAKWNQLLDFVSHRKCAGAYVAVSTEKVGDADNTNVVADFLEANEPIPAYLCGNRVSPKSS